MSDGSAPVFDTSSLVAVLLDDDAPSLPVLFDGHVLELTFYEAGNVLWKIHALQERTTPEEHAELVSLVPDLRREMTVHDLDDIGFEAVMNIASDSELTFYDAAYVACAEQLGTTLVTEDRELREAGSATISTACLEDVS